MLYRIEKFLKKYNLNDTTVVVGFSGGYDSIALLYALTKLSESFNLKLCAAHLNHNWRKNEADKEEENCRIFCEQNNINFYSEKLPKSVQQTETAAREARYNFFKRAASHFNTDKIFTAHNATDNAETLLYRIVKGSGIKGLIGIEEVRKIDNFYVYRPILNIYREEIETFCIENKLIANNDSSNFEIKYKRNFIRHEIFPRLKNINEKVHHAINSLSELAKQNEELVLDYVKTVKDTLIFQKKYKTEKFIELSYALKSRIIYDFVIDLGLEYDRKKVKDIIDFICQSSLSKSGKTFSLADNMWLFCSSEYFYTIKNEPDVQQFCIKVEDYNSSYRFGNFVFSIKKTDELFKTYPKEDENYAVIELPKDVDLTLRYRQKGDIIQPFGMTCTTKLKKYFINKAIPKHEKDKVILLCNNNEVLWASKVGLSEKLRVKTKATHIIRIDEV